MPEVERLARAIAEKHGDNPDAMVPETGYHDAELMPLWWRYQGDAMKFIAMRDACALSFPSAPPRGKP